MPAPIFALSSYAQAQRQSIKFGGYTVPNLGTTAPFTDLNDAVSWFADDFIIEIDRQLTAKQSVWLSKGVWQSEDFGQLLVTIPFIFDEGGGQTFAAAKQALLALGEQYLTIDNNATAMLAKCSKIAKPVTTGVPPYRFAGQLEFRAKEPWWKDVAATSSLANAVAGSAAGVATTIAITPSGSIFAEPVFTLHVPIGNTVTISQLKIQNAASGEILVINFSPILPANTVKTITIDSGIFKAVDESSVESDVLGSFPRLYPGAAQNIVVTIVSSAATTGVTFDIVYNARWIP